MRDQVGSLKTGFGCDHNDPEDVGFPGIEMGSIRALPKGANQAVAVLPRAIEDPGSSAFHRQALSYSLCTLSVAMELHLSGCNGSAAKTGSRLAQPVHRAQAKAC